MLWVLICTVHLTVCYHHVTYEFQSESILYSLPECFAKWLSVCLRTKWLWFRIPLLSLKLKIWRLLWERSSLTFETRAWHDNNIRSTVFPLDLIVYSQFWGIQIMLPLITTPGGFEFGLIFDKTILLRKVEDTMFPNWPISLGNTGHVDDKYFMTEAVFNPIQDGLFRGCSLFRTTKICHTYPTMMKRGTVIPYPKKIQKIYESRDTPLEFYWHQHFFTGNQQILLYEEIQI